VSDYTPTTATPTTEQVRIAFATHTNGGWAEISPGLGELFDRWLAQHDAEVAEAKEKAIIKLLEALQTHKECFGEHHEDWVWSSPAGIIEVLTKWDSEPIALIKDTE